MTSIDFEDAVAVRPTHWRDEAAAAVARGEWLEWLFGVDVGAADGAGGADGHSAALDVIAMYRSETSTSMVRTQVTPSVPLPSVADLCPSASGYERELAEMFGVTVAGGDDRRLLLQWLGDDVHAPLRRTFPLRTRLVTDWPGAQEGRRVKVPGVHPEWREEQRLEQQRLEAQ